MADEITTIPGPEEDIKDVVRNTQVARLIIHMTDNRITSLAEGCRDLGLNPRSVRRWLDREENKQFLAEFKARELAAAVQSAVSSVGEVVARQANIALNSLDERNATRAATWLMRFLETYGNLAPAGMTEGRVVAEFKRTFTLSGPATFHIESQNTDG